MNFRRIHLIVGLLSTLAFVLTGQVMRHHHPPISSLAPDIHMMFVSRHIYLLGAALLNLILGLYLRDRPAGWRLMMQRFASILICVAPVLLLVAFCVEPERGMAGRGWWSRSGVFTAFGGVILHCAGALFPTKNAALN